MKSFKGKKLLILAGAAVHCKVVEAAKDMGVHTIVTDYLESSPAKEMADEKWMLNITDVDAIVERCREEHVDGVLNFCIDPAQRPYVQICERLGLPCFATSGQMHIMTDKPSFKEFCIENGLDVIPAYTPSDIENGNCEYPIFVKPTDSRGSRGQAVCYNKEEARIAIEQAKKESSNGGVVIEKFMQGKQDFSMTYFFANGKPHLTRTGDRYLGKIEDGLNKQCIGSVSPSFNTQMYLGNVHDRVVKALTRIGIKNGPIFMQGFVDGDTVRFYDPGLRFPGTDYEKLLLEATGINLMKELISFALGGDISDYEGKLAEGYLLDGKLSVQLLVSARAGTIATFDGIDEISAHPDVVTVSQRYFPGETIPPSGDVKQRICEIVILSDRSCAKETAEWVYSKLKVLDSDGNDMLVSRFNTDKL